MLLTFPPPTISCLRFVLWRVRYVAGLAREPQGSRI